MKHTPGPWSMIYENEHYFIDAPHMPLGKRDIARVSLGNRDAAELNARLIAAAPELLEALQELVAEFDKQSEDAAKEPGCYGLNETGGIAYARTIIAKATGGE